MPTSLRLYHAHHWSLDTPAKDGDADTITVQTAAGPELRKRQKVNHTGGYTDIDMPDDYPSTPIEWAHFEAAIIERHASTEWVAEVAMRPGGDKAKAKRVAAVFDAKLVDWKKETP